MNSNRVLQWVVGIVAVVAALWGRLSEGEKPQALRPSVQSSAGVTAKTKANGVEGTDGLTIPPDKLPPARDASLVEAWGTTGDRRGIGFPSLFGLLFALPASGLMFLLSRLVQLLHPDEKCVQAEDVVWCSLVERQGLVTGETSLAIAAALIATALGVAFVTRPQEKPLVTSGEERVVASEGDHLNVRTDAVVFVLSIVSAVVGYLAVFNMVAFEPEGFGAALGAALLCLLSLLLLDLVRISKVSQTRVGLEVREKRLAGSRKMIATFAWPDGRRGGVQRGGAAYLRVAHAQRAGVAIATLVFASGWMVMMTGQWSVSILLGTVIEVAAIFLWIGSAAGAVDVSMSPVGGAALESRFQQVSLAIAAMLVGFVGWAGAFLVAVRGALPGVEDRHEATNEDIGEVLRLGILCVVGFLIWTGLLSWVRYAESRRAARGRRGISEGSPVPAWRRRLSPMSNYFAGVAVKRVPVLEESVRQLEARLKQHTPRG